MSMRAWQDDLRHGLTLIEVVVAIGLLATVVAATTPWLRDVQRVAGDPLAGTVWMNHCAAVHPDDLLAALAAGGRFQLAEDRWIEVRAPAARGGGQASATGLAVQVVECALFTSLSDNDEPVATVLRVLPLLETADSEPQP